MKCFAIKDKKSTGFGVPYFALTYGLGERAFKELQQDEKSYVHKYPADFSLYCLGEYDEKSGTLIPEVDPKKICDAEPQNN